MYCAARANEWRYHPASGPHGWFGHPGWIVLMILGFIFWWPAGLAILVLGLWSRWMGCWSGHGHGRWQEKMDRMQARMDRFRSRMDNSDRGSEMSYAPSSGNRAFDEYRTETLKRLEEEQHEFRDFLDRLRFAKDKTEFDQFMADRRARPPAPPAPPSSPPQG